MPYDTLRNLAYGTVLLPPTPPNLGTQLTLANGHGARFPTANFTISIWPFGVPADPTNTELARCTGRAGDVLTIQRQQEGTQLRTILAGDQVAQAMTARFITDLVADLKGYTDTLRTYVDQKDSENFNSLKTYIDAQDVAYANYGHIPRVYSAAAVTAAALNTDAYDMLNLFAQSVPLSMANTLGTPNEGQSMVLRVRDDGLGPHAITWSAQYMSALNGVALPANVPQFRLLHMAFRYNSAFGKWQMIAIVQD